MDAGRSKMRYAKFVIYGLALILLLVSGCVPSRGETTIPTDTLDIKLTPTLSVSSSAVPSPTLAESPALGNNQCLLPCWQGITPGVSSFNDLTIEVQTLLGIELFPESIIFQGEEYLSAYAYRDFSLNSTEIHFGLGTYTRSDTESVEVLDIWADVINHQEGDKSKGKNAYWRFFNNYSLQKILTNYGIPDTVLIFGELYPEDFLREREAFHLRLLYPAKGIYVSYDMPLERVEGNGIACPFDANFDLWLTSPDLSQSHEAWWESSQGYTDFSSTFDTPIEEGIGMNTESFYEIFSSENAPCIVTPIKIWLP